MAKISARGCREIGRVVRFSTDETDGRKIRTEAVRKYEAAVVVWNRDRNLQGDALAAAHKTIRKAGVAYTRAYRKWARLSAGRA